MKILLGILNENRCYTPLALLYLNAILLNDGYLRDKVEVEIKEFDLSNSDDFILHEMQKCKPDVIGFSCYVWNIKRILSVSRKMKDINRHAKIILGGPQVSPIAKYILGENRQIDIIVRGEGEITFLELVKSMLTSTGDISSVSGITHRDNGRIVDNPDREIISNLDSIPYPYISNFPHIDGKEVCLETQRGCVFKCDFCYYNKNFNRVRFFSMERVKKELSFLLSQKLMSIYLMDPVFNLDVNRAKEICRFIAQHNKHNIPFHTEIRAELVDEELAELFQKANIKHLEVGLQSTEKRVLRSVDRELNTRKFIDGINLLKKHNVGAEVHLILGLPHDTFHLFKKSLEFVLDLETADPEVFRLGVLPGTKIREKAKELGIVYEEEPPHNFLQSKELPFDRVIELQKIINSVYLFRTKKTIKYLCKETKIKLLDMIELWICWLGDDNLLLNPGNNYILKNKFRKFIEYFCKKNDIDSNFYNALLRKEIAFSTKPESEKIRRENERMRSKNKDGDTERGLEFVHGQRRQHLA